jgi:hypothetical protein
MDKQRIIQAFADIGAQATVQPMPWPDFAEALRPVDVTVGRDAIGDYFDVRIHPHVAVTNVTARVHPTEDCLVLTMQTLGDTFRFACGRDGDRLYATPLDVIRTLVS